MTNKNQWVHTMPTEQVVEQDPSVIKTASDEPSSTEDVGTGDRKETSEASTAGEDLSSHFEHSSVQGDQAMTSAMVLKRNKENMTGSNLQTRNVTPQASPRKKPKLPPLSDYDMSTEDKIVESFKRVKGEETSLPPSPLDMLLAILNDYKVEELKLFTKERLRCEWPKGNKPVGVRFIASQLLKEVGALSEFKEDVVIKKSNSEDKTFSQFLAKRMDVNYSIVREFHIEAYDYSTGDNMQTEKSLLVLKSDGGYMKLCANQNEDCHISGLIKRNDGIHVAWRAFPSLPAMEQFLSKAKAAFEDEINSEDSDSPDKAKFKLSDSMTRDTSVLSQFGREVTGYYYQKSPSMVSALVGVKYDASIDVLLSTDTDIEKLLSAINTSKMPIYYCWKYFKNPDEATTFAEKLQAFNLLSQLPNDPKVQIDARDKLLRQLTNKSDTLQDFTNMKIEYTFNGNNSNVRDVHLVILRNDGGVHVYSSSGKETAAEFMALTGDLSSLYGWKLFPTHYEALRFSDDLKGIDQSLGLPSFSMIRDTQSHEKMNAAGMGGVNLGENSYGTMKSEFDPASVAIGSPDNGTNYHTPTKPTRPRNPYAKSSPAWSSASTPSTLSGKESRQGMFPSHGVKPSGLDGVCDFDMSGVALKTNQTKFQGAKIQVSHVFPHKHASKAFAFVFMMVPSQLYFLEGKFIKLFADEFISRVLKPKGMPIPLYLTTVGDMPLCKPSTPDQYLRNAKRYVKMRPYWMIEIPNKMGSIEAHVISSINTFASKFKEGSDIGETFVSYVRENKPSVYNLETGQTNRKKKVTHQQFVKKMQQCLVQMFAQKTVEYQVTLDKVMTYGHIKEFLVNYCEYDNWEELHMDMKPAIMSKWQDETYPEWEKTEVMPFVED